MTTVAIGETCSPRTDSYAEAGIASSKVNRSIEGIALKTAPTSGERGEAAVAGKAGNLLR